MIIYTLYDYFKLYPYVIKQRNYGLKDNNQNYSLEVSNSKKGKQYHKHDKLFREILNRNKEIVKLINKYVKPKKELTEEMIEKYDTKYLTSIYEKREADIVYKLKGKEVFFLIEHQTKVDKLMSYRILEYSLEIIRTRMKNIKGKIEKVGVPKVIPLVIYTGQAKWTAKNKLEEVQVEFEHFNGIDVVTGYNLIDIRNEEEAIKEGTAVARMSIIERKNDTENIIDVVRRMSKYVKDKEERQEFAKEIKYLLSDKLTKEEIEEIENILMEKEGEDAMLHAQMVIRRDFEKAKEEGRREGMLHAQEVIRRDFEKAKEEGRREGMLHAQEVIRRDFEKAKEEGRREGMLHAQEVIRRNFENAKKKGIKEGLEEGRKEGIMSVAKKLIEEKVDLDFIIRITGLTKEQLMKI